MTAALLLLADNKPANVGSGAVLTLVLPLGLVLIALCTWWFMARRAGRAREPVEFSGPEAKAAPGPAPE
jgi:hypothetical protein